MWTDRRTLALTLALAPAALLFAGASAAFAFSVEALDLGGATVRIPAPAPETLRIVINVPARRLYLVEGPRLVESWPVAVGKPATPTPVGRFRILQMAKDPTWAPRGRPAVPPGPRNPLGTRWMRISEDGYGIHATNEPGSVGHARSHGCVRMRGVDAESLYARVTIGTPVEIVYDVHGWDDAVGPVTYPDLYALEQKTRP